MDKRESQGRRVPFWRSLQTKYALTYVVIVAAVMFFTVSLSRYKGIPTALLWVALIICVYAYITSKTTMGRHLYAVGGNEKATKLSGIDTKKVYFFAYANMGFLAALAGRTACRR